jgi:PAS domain S-box-containing protein
LADDVETLAEFFALGPHKVLEDAPIGTLVIRSDGTIAWANRSAMTTFGYSRAQFVGKHVNFLLPQDRIASHQSYISGWFMHPKARPMATSHLHIQGLNRNRTLMDLDIQLSPIETQDGILALAWVQERTEPTAPVEGPKK